MKQQLQTQDQPDWRTKKIPGQSIYKDAGFSALARYAGRTQGLTVQIQRDRGHSSMTIYTILRDLKIRLTDLEQKKATFGPYLPTHFAVEFHDVLRDIQHYEQLALAPPPEQHAAAPEASHVPCPLLLVCSAPDDPLSKELQAALGLYGISVELLNEHRLGQPTIQQRQYLLPEAQAVVVQVTPDTLKQRALDLKDLLASNPDAAAGMPIIPLYNPDCTASQLQKELKAVHTNLDIEIYPGLRLPAVMTASELLDYAQTIAQAIIPAFLQALPADQLITIDVFDLNMPGYPYPASLRLDWRESRRMLQGVRVAWDELAAITRTLHGLLIANRRDRVALRIGYASYSAALLVGYTFRRRTGFELTVYDHNSKIWWAQAATPSPVTLVRSPVDTHPHPEGVSIELAISRPINVEHISAAPHNLTRFQRMQLTLEEGPAPTSIRGSEHAAAVTAALAAAIQASATDHSIHLLGALPAALLALLGAELHACTPIQWYEFDNNRKTYIPGCLIKDLR